LPNTWTKPISQRPDSEPRTPHAADDDDHEASMMTVAAMPFEAVTSGAASTPPSAARPQPIPNTHERMSLMSTPSALPCRRSASGADQQPERDRSRNCQIATATTMRWREKER